MKKVYPDLMLIDGGDTGEAAFARVAWKTPMIWDEMKKMGYEVISLGERDYSDTSMVWLENNQSRGTVFLAGNLTRESGPAWGPEYVILQKNGLRIGVVSYIVQNFALRFPGFSLAAPEDFLSKAQKAFTEAKVDYRILIYHGNVPAASTIAQERKDFDLILLGHANGMPMRSNIEVGKIPMVGPGDRGRELALVTLEKTVKDGSAAVSCTILPMDDKFANSPKISGFLIKARELAMQKFSTNTTPAQNAGHP